MKYKLQKNNTNSNEGGLRYKGNGGHSTNSLLHPKNSIAGG
jgi:hypothetical protein